MLFLLGRLLLALAASLLVPAGLAWYERGPEARVFLIAASITGGLGWIVQRAFESSLRRPFGRREAFVLVSVTWVMASIVGALPYVLIKGPGFVIDGLFEAVSGFTTTGASILDDVEAEPHALVLWRSMTQWLGGMGIIVLGIAVLPKLAIGGMQLLAAEAPGPTTEKLTPRIAKTAKALWGIYALLTALQAGVLVALGLDPFEAVNHALTTVATGGFSTRNASVGAFGGEIQLVTTVFMLLAGINFALHFHFLQGRPRRLAQDPELRLYAWLMGGATLFVAGDLLIHGGESNLLTALRLAAFQCSSILTTTGFATVDFDAWPGFSKTLLFMLMFVGGCAGSTAGSVKIVRILIVAGKFGAELKRLAQPHLVCPVRVGGRAIPEEIVNQVTTFLLLYVAVFAVGALSLAMSGLDLVTGISASATCLGNVGPGFGAIGPTHTMSQLPAASKLIMLVLMIVGRLELYTALISFFFLGRLLQPARPAPIGAVRGRPFGS